MNCARSRHRTAFVFFSSGVDKKAGETFIVTKRIASHEKYHLIFIENYLRRTLIGSWTSLKEVYLYSSVVEQGQNEAYTMFTVFLPQTYLKSSPLPFDEIEWKISMDPILAKRERKNFCSAAIWFFYVISVNSVVAIHIYIELQSKANRKIVIRRSRVHKIIWNIDHHDMKYSEKM